MRGVMRVDAVVVTTVLRMSGVRVGVRLGVRLVLRGRGVVAGRAG